MGQKNAPTCGQGVRYRTGGDGFADRPRPGWLVPKRPIIFAAGAFAPSLVIIRSLPNFCLQHVPNLGILRLEWVAHSDLRHLRASAGQLLVLLATLEIRCLLLDMNSVPNLSLADQIWLGEHWMPGLVASALECLVLVIDSTQVHNQLAIDALHDLAQPEIRFASHYFSDNLSAFDWLTDGSPQLPALEAEWAAISN